MSSSAVEQIGMIMRIPSYAGQVLFVLVGLAAIAGVVMAATTRPDAFDAAGRLSKMGWVCLLYTSPSPRDRQKSRMPSSA